MNPWLTSQQVQKGHEGSQHTGACPRELTHEWHPEDFLQKQHPN